MDEGRQMQLVHKLRHPALPDDDCPMRWYDLTPHIHPLYGVFFDPDACYGPAPFAPVH